MVSIGAIVLLLGLFGGSAVALFAYLPKILTLRNDPGDALEIRVAELELKVLALPSLWEEERKRALRAQDAGRKSRKDAEDKLEEVQELIEANLAVPGVDEALGDQHELHPVPTRLGDAPAADKRERVAAIAHLLR